MISPVVETEIKPARPGRPRRLIELRTVPDDVRMLRVEELREAMRLMVHVGPAAAAPGIYFLLDDAGQVVYVGQSKNVASRMRGHAGKEFQDIRMLRVDAERARDRLEILFINVFRPKYNVTYNVLAAQ